MVSIPVAWEFTHSLNAHSIFFQPTLHPFNNKCAQRKQKHLKILFKLLVFRRVLFILTFS